MRQYQEAILVGLLLKDPSLIEEYLLPVVTEYEHRLESLFPALPYICHCLRLLL